MKLHSTHFEAALTGKVLADIHFDPQLEEEYQRVRAFKRTGKSLWNLFKSELSFLMFTVTWGGIFLSKTGDLESYLFVANSWLTIWIFSFSTKWKIKNNPNDLEIFKCFPVKDDTIYRWERFKILKSSIRLPIYLFAACLITFLYFKLSIIQFILSILISIIIWLNCLILSLYFAGYRPFRSLLIVMGSLLAYNTTKVDFLPDDLKEPFINTSLIDAVTPTGWMVSLIHILTWDPLAYRGLLAFALILLIFGVRKNLQWFRNSLILEETVSPLVPDFIPGEEIIPKKLQNRSALPIAQTEIEAGLRSGEFLDQIPWESGLDRTAWSWLTKRERVLTEFVFSKPPNLWLPWRTIITRLGALTCVGYLIGFYSISIQSPLFFLGILLVSSDLVTVITLRNWLKITRDDKILGFAIFFYPIGFREISATFIKTMLSQSLLIFFYTCLIVLASSLFTGSFDFGYLMITPESILLLSVCQLIYLTVTFGGQVANRPSVGAKVGRYLLAYFLASLIIFLPMGILENGLSPFTVSLSGFCVILGGLLAFWVADCDYRDRCRDITFPKNSADNSTGETQGGSLSS